MSLAAILLRGAWELSHDPKLLQELARTNTMAGQFAEAIENYELLLKLGVPSETAEQVRAELRRLREMPVPFSDVLTERARASDEAQRAFTTGLAYARRHAHTQAIPYLRAALILDPLLPGPFRVLGGVYGELRDSNKEMEFFQDYLRIRPDGKIADQVRHRLKPKGLLASVHLTASFPCDVWVNGRPMDKATPLDGLLLPRGTHTVSFVNSQYHIIRNMQIKLSPGEKVQREFSFGVVTLKLKPWARARANGRDLGLWESIGLPAGEYSLALEAYDESKRKDVRVSIRGGQSVTVDTW